MSKKQEIINTKLRKRSKKYSNNYYKIQNALEGKEVMDISEACKLLFELEKPNYKDGPSVELHIKLNINPTKSDQLVRSSVVLPHGTGKKIRIAAFVEGDKVKEAKDAGADLVGSDDLIEDIKKTGSIDFDKAVAQPAMMKKLPAIARILGVAGVMPNPKTGTVGENIKEIIETIKAGKVDFKNDKTGNIHFSCGKINSNFDPNKIEENVKKSIEAIEKAKPEAVKKKYINTIHLATTLSPSIRIK